MIKKLPKHINTLLFAIAFVFLNSCELINPEEIIPSFINVEKIKIKVDHSEQGSDSHKITDTWVYIDNIFLGVYELPCQFPVLEEGIHKVSFKAGIKVNGIAATRAIYPFYLSITLDTFLLKDDIIYFDTLTTKYSTIAKFPWKEDFEDSGISLEPTFHSDTTINKISNDPVRVFEGTYSGKIILTDSISFFNIKTSEAWPLPASNVPVFLELNYKTNNPFHVGIYSNTISESIQHDLLIITESDDWNKIYVNLTEVVSREFNAIDYNIWFGAVKNENVDTAEILLDNIKLIHF